MAVPTRIRWAVRRVIAPPPQTRLGADEQPVSEPARQAGAQDLVPGYPGGVGDAPEHDGARPVVVDAKAAFRIAVARLPDRAGVDQVAIALDDLEDHLVARRGPARDAAPLQDKGARVVAVAEKAEIERQGLEATVGFMNFR